MTRWTAVAASILGISLVTAGCVGIKVKSPGGGVDRYFFGVSSAGDIKRLRSGRICAALARGGVRCLGPDVIRAISSRNVSRRQKAFLWDDGYCIAEPRSRHGHIQRIRCEWFNPFDLSDRRIIFRDIPGGVKFVAFRGGVCACSDVRAAVTPGPYEAALCIATRENAASERIAMDGHREQISLDMLEVIEIDTSEVGQKISVCGDILSDPSAVDQILPPRRP